MKTREQCLAQLSVKLPFEVYVVLMAMIKAYQPAMQQMISGKGTDKHDLEPALDFDHDAIAAGLSMAPKEYLRSLKVLRCLGYIQRIKVSGVGICWRINFRKIMGEGENV